MPEITEAEIERILRARAEGKLAGEIARELNGPPPLTLEEQTASANRQSLQQQRGALNADAAPPGTEPDVDPVQDGFRAAEASGHQRGSDGRMDAYLEKVFTAAQAGDPRVVSQGVVDAETRERWEADAHRRQLANRDQSQARHR
jgi:hypothetical protein